MRRVEGQVDKERLAVAIGLLDDLDRPVGEVVDTEAVAADQPPVVLQRRAEVVAPVTRTEPVELGEAPAVGVVGRLHPVVPLAEGRGDVAGPGKHVADGPFVQVQPLATGRRAVDAAAGMIAAGQELGPRRRTDRADIEAAEAGTVTGQRVDVRGAEVAVAVEAEVTPALVVGQDDQDVGTSRRGKNGRQQRQGDGQQHSHHFFTFFPVNSPNTCSMFSSRVFTSTPVHSLYHGRSIEVLISSSVLPSSMDFWMACRNSTKYRF